MHSDTSVSADDGVALVPVRVNNDVSVDRRVRLRNRLDGLVFPPCHASIPEPSWDNEGFEGVAPAGSMAAFGYAAPLSPPGGHDAEAVDADGLPGHMVGVETLGHADEPDEAADSTSEGAIRPLGLARSPTDTVPVSADPSPAVSVSETPGSAPDTAGDERPGPFPRPNPDTTGGERSIPSGQPMDTDASAMVGMREPRDHETQRPSKPAPLTAVEHRIDLAKWPDGVSVTDAAAAFLEVERGAEVFESLDADHERPRRLAARAATLTDHAADADSGVDALRGLA